MKESLTKAVEYYESNKAIRAAVNLIPYVGGSIDVLISSKGQEITQKRTESLLNHLSTQILEIPREFIKNNYFETEEGFDLLIKSFEVSAKTRHEEKRKALAKLLSSVNDQRKSYSQNDPEIFLDIIESLTFKELTIAEYLHQNNQISSRILARKYSEYSDEEFEYCLIRLTGIGLARLITENRVPKMDAHGILVEYETTRLYHRFFNFLQVK